MIPTRMKLIPCPCCGKSPELILVDIYGFDNNRRYRVIGEKFQIECTNSQCKRRPATIKYDFKRDAIFFWNNIQSENPAIKQITTKNRRELQKRLGQLELVI